MSAGLVAVRLERRRAEEGEGGSGGMRRVVELALGASGVQRQKKEVTVCWGPRPLGRGSGPALTPSLPAHGSRVTSLPTAPPTTATAIKSLAQLQAGAQ